MSFSKHSWFPPSFCLTFRHYFFNASIIFWNSWRPRKNFENMYDWCCLLNAYKRLIDYFGMTFASILACVLCRLLSQTWLMPKIMTSQKFRLWLLLQIASMSGTKDRESWWLLLFVSTFWDTLKKIWIYDWNFDEGEVRSKNNCYKGLW